MGNALIVIAIVLALLLVSYGFYRVMVSNDGEKYKLLNQINEKKTRFISQLETLKTNIQLLSGNMSTLDELCHPDDVIPLKHKQGTLLRRVIAIESDHEATHEIVVTTRSKMKQHRDLNNAYDQALRTLTIYQDEYRDLVTEINELQKNIDRANRAVGQTIQELDQSQAHIAQLIGQGFQVQETENRLTQLEAELEPLRIQMNMRKYQDAIATAATIQGEIRDITAAARDLANQRTTALQELTSFKKRIAQIQALIVEERQRVTQIKLKFVGNIIRQADTYLDRAEDTLQELVSFLPEIEANVSMEKQEWKEALAQIRQNNRSLTHANEAVAKSVQIRQKIEADFAKLQAELEQTKSNFESLWRFFFNYIYDMNGDHQVELSRLDDEFIKVEVAFESAPYDLDLIRRLLKEFNYNLKLTSTNLSNHHKAMQKARQPQSTRKRTAQQAT